MITAANIQSRKEKALVSVGHNNFQTPLNVSRVNLKISDMKPLFAGALSFIYENTISKTGAAVNVPYVDNSQICDSIQSNSLDRSF
jgi:hypothetical protein